MNKPKISNEMREIWRRSHSDWCYFAEKILNVNLDNDQKRIIRSIQNEPRVSIRSGNARGKDFVAAVVSNCWLHLYHPSKVINTAPTGRQAEAIMMTEITRIRNGSRVPLGGRVLTNGIKFDNEPERYLMAFKASDTRDEVWTGYHSPNIMVVVTEASGIDDRTFDNIEKLLQGNSRLLIVFNPNRMNGEAYRSITSPQYKSFRLNCLDAPNVVAKRIIIPGQVDWNWINNLIHKPGMVTSIDESEVKKEMYDFQWEGEWYRPSDLFLVMVIGEPPRENESQLIPYAWILAAIDRWHEQSVDTTIPLRLGADIAGMGADKTALLFRYGSYVEKIKTYPKSKHMETVGKIKNEIVAHPGCKVLIDTIGEGAGVYSRLDELEESGMIAAGSSTSAKVSQNAKGLHDLTGLRTFSNMRAYCIWAVRDALDPSFDTMREPLALPPNDDLVQELVEHRWETKSNGDIYIESKDEIKERLGRSPDNSDALALSYFPPKKMKDTRTGTFSRASLGLPG